VIPRSVSPPERPRRCRGPAGSQPGGRGQRGRPWRTGLIELLLAVLTGSVGLLGDGIHNLSDVSTSAVVFAGSRLSRRPATERYPYGLERAEDLAGIGIAAVVTVMSAVGEATRYEQIMAAHSVRPGDCSRLTWSFAATRPDRLAEAPWLLNSFIKSNAADVCARLGLTLAQYQSAMLACGVSLEPDVRADQPAQAQALLRFVGMPEVARAVRARIEAMRRLVLDYAAQHGLAEADTGLVDIGWTGRMVASLIWVCEAAGMSRPHILFWGHEPRQQRGGQIPNECVLTSTTPRPGKDWNGGYPTLRSLWKPSAWVTMALSLAIARPRAV